MHALPVPATCPESHPSASSGESVVLMGSPHLVEQVAGRDYRVSADSFFQVNTAGAEVLVDLVQGYLAPAGGETLVDLYCGVGLFCGQSWERV